MPAPPSRGSTATAGRQPTAPEPPRWRRTSPTARALGHPTSLRIEGGCGNEGSGMAKVRSHSPFSSSFLSWLSAQDAREAEKAKRDDGKWLGEPKQPLSLRFYSLRRAGPPPQPESTALNAVDFAVADGLAPRPQSLPRAHAAITAAR